MAGRIDVGHDCDVDRALVGCFPAYRHADCRQGFLERKVVAVKPTIFENDFVERFDAVFQTFDDVVKRTIQIESCDNKNLQTLPRPTGEAFAALDKNDSFDVFAVSLHVESLHEERERLAEEIEDAYGFQTVVFGQIHTIYIAPSEKR